MLSVYLHLYSLPLFTSHLSLIDSITETIQIMLLLLIRMKDIHHSMIVQTTQTKFLSNTIHHSRLRKQLSNISNCQNVKLFHQATHF